MNKAFFVPNIILISICIILFSALCRADTIIVLQDGSQYDGKIVQKTDKTVTLRSSGGNYYLPVKDIKIIKGDTSSSLVGPDHLTKQNSKAIPLTQTQRIDRILGHLGYPRKKWPYMEKEIITLLKKIDFTHLKKEAVQVKSDPLKLKKFVGKLGALLDQKGYLDTFHPHPLVKSLTAGFVDDDISQEILTSSVSFGQKVESIKALVACTAISQLGSIVLDLLGIEVKIAFSPGHVFNCIPLEGGQVLFVDFSNQIFEIVDINKYYMNLGSRTKLLKDRYRVSPDRLIEIKGQLPSEYQTDTLQDLFSFLYLYVYISDNDATTPAIFLNLGNIYAGKGNMAKAIFYYDRAIALNPAYAEAYLGRGIIYGNEGNLTQAASDFCKAIDLFPEFTEAYRDLGNIYGARGDIDDAINDLDQAIIIDPENAQAYLDRGKMYSQKGDVAKAISDYTNAIGIDPYFSDAYKSRAQAYFDEKEYDKSWHDIHKLEDFGEELNPDLLDKLKRASQFRDFCVILVIAPILILILFFYFK